MKHSVCFYIRKIMVLLLTIVVNQSGELVPDRTKVIQMLTDLVNDLTEDINNGF